MFRKCLLHGTLNQESIVYKTEWSAYTPGSARLTIIWSACAGQPSHTVKSTAAISIGIIGQESRWNMIIQESHWMERWIQIKAWSCRDWAVFQRADAGRFVERTMTRPHRPKDQSALQTPNKQGHYPRPYQRPRGPPPPSIQLRSPAIPFNRL